jgi:hypothetical protein
VRGLAKLESEEWDRCANFASKAVGAGRNERMVRLAERQGEMLVQVVRAALADAELSLPPERQQVVLRVIGRHMRELARS